MSNLSSIKVKPLQPVKDQPPLVYRSLPGDAGNPLPKKAKLFPRQRPLPAAAPHAKTGEEKVEVAPVGDDIKTTVKRARKVVTSYPSTTRETPIMAVRVPAELQKAAKALAKENGITFTLFISSLLEQAIEEKQSPEKRVEWAKEKIERYAQHVIATARLHPK